MAMTEYIQTIFSFNQIQLLPGHCEGRVIEYLPGDSGSRHSNALPSVRLQEIDCCSHFREAKQPQVRLKFGLIIIHIVFKRN